MNGLSIKCVVFKPRIVCNIVLYKMEAGISVTSMLIFSRGFPG